VDVKTREFLIDHLGRNTQCAEGNGKGCLVRVRASQSKLRPESRACRHVPDTDRAPARRRTR
jgi:hypothetical protein